MTQYCLLLCAILHVASSFESHAVVFGRFNLIQNSRPATSRTTIYPTLSLSTSSLASTSWDDDDAPATRPKQTLPNMEKAWRYAKKPLLRIGSKGVSRTHGNSLRQLLKDHTVVKVKVNTQKYGTLEDSFNVLAKLVEEADSGEIGEIEYLQSRKGENTILFGIEGTLKRIEAGEFPPPPPKTKEGTDQQ